MAFVTFERILSICLMFQTFVIVVQSPSSVRLLATIWTAAHQAFLSLTISRSLPKFMFIASVMLSSHFILWFTLLLLPLIFPSIRDFSIESSVHIRWWKYWSVSFSPSCDYSGLISFKIGWFDHPETLRSPPAAQFKGINSLAFCCSVLTTLHDHSLDYTYICQQSNVSPFQHTV